MEPVTSQTLVRCDACQQEFELFSRLDAATRCLGGRPHRAVRIVRAA